MTASPTRDHTAAGKPHLVRHIPRGPGHPVHVIAGQPEVPRQLIPLHLRGSGLQLLDLPSGEELCGHQTRLSDAKG